MSDIKTKKIALIQGGFGIERDISLITGRNTAQAFSRLKLSFKKFSADENLSEKLKKYQPDLAFLAVHGPYGEDGTLQGILEYLKIPYTGCGVLLSALCMDKILFKKWLFLQKIPSPAFIHLSSVQNFRSRKCNSLLQIKDSAVSLGSSTASLLRKQESSDTHISNDRHLNLDFSNIDQNIKLSHLYTDKPSSISEKKVLDDPLFLPCVVKPCRSGSSIGTSICRSQEDWTHAIQKALEIDHNILVESYIEGVEIAVPILNKKILTPVEIQPADGHFYDFKRKYEKNQSQYFVPPRSSKYLIEKTKNITDQIQKLFQITSYGRADFIIDKKENIYVLEFNTLPGLTPLSLLPKSAQYDGIAYDEVILTILESASLDYP